MCSALAAGPNVWPMSKVLEELASGDPGLIVESVVAGGLIVTRTLSKVRLLLEDAGGSETWCVGSNGWCCDAAFAPTCSAEGEVL